MTEWSTKGFSNVGRFGVVFTDGSGLDLSDCSSNSDAFGSLESTFNGPRCFGNIIDGLETASGWGPGALGGFVGIKLDKIYQVILHSLTIFL